jgi:hypothetical protein
MDERKRIDEEAKKRRQTGKKVETDSNLKKTRMEIPGLY